MFEAVHYIKHAAPASLYFQFVHDDQYISKDHADQFFAAASSPKEILLRSDAMDYQATRP